MITVQEAPSTTRSSTPRPCERTTATGKTRKCKSLTRKSTSQFYSLLKTFESMNLRTRSNRRKADDDDFEPSLEDEGTTTRRRAKEYPTRKNAHHKADYFEEQRLEKMLEEQEKEGSEHDNDIGDDTDQEIDRESSSEGKGDEESKAAEEAAKRYNSNYKKSSKNNDDPDPMLHLIESILGDRFPTLPEYHQWLQQEEDRKEGQGPSGEFEKICETLPDENVQVKHTENLKQEIIKMAKEDAKVVMIDEPDEERKSKTEDSTQATVGDLVTSPGKPVEEEKKPKIDSKAEKAAKLAEKFEDEKPEEMQYLVKFKNLSYRKCRWINESDFFEIYSFQCQQKLNRYKIKKKKELENGVYVPPCDEEDKYFDHSFLEVCKIITCSNLFPVIHPRQARNVANTWRQKCVNILQLLSNYVGDDHCYSTPFLFLRTDERSVMDFTTINNRLHTLPPSDTQQSRIKSACYTKPQDFWTELSLVFKENMRNNHPGTRKRIYLDTLRELTYHLYRAWREHLIKIKQTQKEATEKEQTKKEEALSAKSTVDDVEDICTQIYMNLAKKDNQHLPSFVQAQYDLSQKLLAQWKKLQQESEQSQLMINQNMASSSENGAPPQPKYTLEQIDVNKKLIYQMSQFFQFLQHQQQQSYANQDPNNYYTQKSMVEQIVQTIRLSKNKSPQAALPKPTADIINLVDESEKEQTHLFDGEAEFADAPLSYEWLLDQHESLEQLLAGEYFEYPEVEEMYTKFKEKIDPLYLVKWRNLSYCDLTWERLSSIRQFGKQLKDFDRFTRSLDNSSRQKLMGFTYAHKQLLKLFSKKLSQGKKIDAKCQEEAQIRDMLDKLLQFENRIENGYFQYDYAKNLVPQFRFGQKMKDYQIAGLNWLLRAWTDKRNVVLADEMGLGKTIQSISFLDHLNKMCKLRGPFLIVAPLSTIDHWKKIAEEWTYMNVVIYHDQKGLEGRREIQNMEWYYTDVTCKGTITQKSKLIKFNLMITSYEIFNQDLKEVLCEIPFQQIIIDEAHRLKNKGTKTLVLLKEHPCRKIFLLTGTPVQNNTKELFTLLNYIEPDKFNSYDKFMTQYGELKNKEQIDSLTDMIRPHFLRRLKDEVEDSIPPLKETVIDVGLTNIQQQYYKGIYGENLTMLASMGQSSLKAASFCNIDIQLRKCCNHLFLLKGVQDDLEKDCHTDEDYFQKLLEGSGKMILLDKFINKYKSDGHKMLIFSQFKGMTEIIKDYLTHKKIRYEILTGNIKSQDRAISIQRFNEDNEFGVFLLTTRAGGLGINLTRARVVIIYDSDWNPQNDLQAIARAHRIGQKFEVEVYRFITDKTYEQHMFERASRKLGMEQALFQKGAFGHDESADISDDKKASPEEIENLLRYGAFAFLDNNEDDEEEEISKMKIEDILASRGKDRSKKAKKGGYSLQKTTFNVDKTKKAEKDKPDVDDPNFWEKVGLPFEGFNAKQLLKKYKARKNDLGKSKENQSKFLKDVSKCTIGLLDAKVLDNSRTIDEEIFELLKFISKNKLFLEKYRTKAQTLLNHVLNFDDYAHVKQIESGQLDSGEMERMMNQGPRRMGRAAKENVDYKSSGIRKRDLKMYNKQQKSQDDSQDEDDPEDGIKLIKAIDKDLEEETRDKKSGQKSSQKDNQNSKPRGGRGRPTKRRRRRGSSEDESDEEEMPAPDLDDEEDEEQEAEGEPEEEGEAEQVPIPLDPSKSSILTLDDPMMYNGKKSSTEKPKKRRGKRTADDDYDGPEKRKRRKKA